MGFHEPFYNLRYVQKVRSHATKGSNRDRRYKPIASSVNHAAQVTIKSRHNQYSQELRCLVLDKITENLPVHIMDMSKITVPENIKLADPRFDCSGPSIS
jgi:hypothetical protein